jgi:hypothetical protein
LQTLAQVAEKMEPEDGETPSTFVIPLRVQSLRAAVDEILAKQTEELTVLEEVALRASKLSWSRWIQSENMLRSRLERVLTNALAVAKEGNSEATKYLLWLSSPIDVDADGTPKYRQEWLQWIITIQEADVVCTTSMPRFVRNILDELKQDEEMYNLFANRIITEYVMGYPPRQEVAEVRGNRFDFLVIDRFAF